MHARTHARTHTRALAHLRTHARTQATLINIYVSIQIFACARGRVCTIMHAYIYTFSFLYLNENSNFFYFIHFFLIFVRKYSFYVTI
jgi:hypothetical protein